MKMLFVIDMQEITVGDQHADVFAYDTSLLQRVNDRISEYDPEHVIYIRNLMKKTLFNRLAPVQVYEGTKEAQLAEKLNVVSDHIFDKYEGNAFTNAELTSFIKEQSPEVIEIIGVDGGGCVALTALGAVSNGYSAKVNQNCVGTILTKKEKKLHDKMIKAGVRFVKP